LAHDLESEKEGYMVNTSNQQSDFIKHIINEAKRVEEDSLFCYAGHSEEARFWQRIDLWIGIPTVVFAAVAGLLSFTKQNSILVGGLAFLVAAISSVSVFLDSKSQQMEHYKACIDYDDLKNRARWLYSIECAKNANGGHHEHLENSLKQLCEKLNELNAHTPIISERARRLANKNIASGRYTYVVDVDKENLKKT